MHDGKDVLAGLTAMHGKRRTETLRDSEPVFVLHRDASQTSLGFLVGPISAEVSSAEAQAWCSERLAEVGVHVTDWEHPINDAECWTMLDPLRVRFYEVRRHYDVWAVVAGLRWMSWQYGWRPWQEQMQARCGTQLPPIRPGSP
jgi:hypothetical protein